MRARQAWTSRGTLAAASKDGLFEVRQGGADTAGEETEGAREQEINTDRADLGEDTEQQRAGRMEQGAGRYVTGAKALQCTETVGHRKQPASADGIVVSTKSNQSTCS